MKWITPGLLGLCVACAAVAGRTAFAGDENGKATATGVEAKKILEKTAAALEKVKFVAYNAKYQGVAWIRDHVADVEGSVLLGEPSEYDIQRFRCEVKLTPQKSEETFELTAGSDGDLYYLIDQANKTVYADIDAAVLGTHDRNLQRVLMRPFVAKDPLSDELKAEEVELLETTVISGEPCQQVRITVSESRHTVWFVSKRDWLPRRVDRFYKNGKGEIGSTQLAISDLVAESKFKLGPFKLTVPQGFTKTDEFAP